MLNFVEWLFLEWNTASNVDSFRVTKIVLNFNLNEDGNQNFLTVGICGHDHAISICILRYYAL